MSKLSIIAIFGIIAFAVVAFLYVRWSVTTISRLEVDLQGEKDAREQTEETFVLYKQQLEESVSNIESLRQETNRIRQRANNLEKVFSRHDLSYLAAQKPGLIERRVNSGTKEVLQRLRDITDKDWVPDNDEEDIE